MSVWYVWEYLLHKEMFIPKISKNFLFKMYIKHYTINDPSRVHNYFFILFYFFGQVFLILSLCCLIFIKMCQNKIINNLKYIRINHEKWDK